MIIPFITEYIKEPVTTVPEMVSSKITVSDIQVLNAETGLKSDLKSLMNRIDTASGSKENSTEIESESDNSFSEKYKMILKRIEKERFERELLAGSG